MYQKADPASIKKNTAQMRHSCTISPLRPPGEPSLTSERGKNPKKCGANAPQLHPILCPSRTNQAIARSWHCQEHSAILLYTAESTCSFCLEHLPYYPGKRRRATNGVLVAKNFSGGGWSGRIGWRRILYIDASPTSQDTRRIAPARPT